MLVAGLAGGVGIGVRAFGGLDWLEQKSVDARFSLRGAQPRPSDVTIVGLDNDSLGSLPRYPFSRRIHARVLDRLHAADARLIVYDIAFDRQTTEAADRALFEAARKAAPVVFATSLISPTGKTETLGGDAGLVSIGDRAAAADLLPDADGVLRHMLTSVSDLPSIATAVSEAVAARGRARTRMNGAWIDYAGPPGTFRTLSFARVLAGRFPPGAVRGKIVVVGATSPSLQDQHATSAGSPMSGPEVQAAAISTALRGFPLRSPGGLIAVLLIVLMAGVVPLSGLAGGALRHALSGLAALAAWCLAVVLAFNSGVVLDFADPMIALAVGSAGTVVLGAWTDGREHRRLREQFASGEQTVVDAVLRPVGHAALAATSVIAGYRLEEVVGRGGMGVVYRALQLGLDRDVAIKVIAADRAGDPLYRARFRSECRIAASLEHVNVIPVYEAGEDDGLLFVAMRLVDGYDLEQLIGNVGPLEAERAARLIGQLAAALDSAHARGLVHRDVKPANVLLTAEEPEHLYLTDFGVARDTRANGITRGEMLGTLDYLAPEQIRGEVAGVGADVYALAGVLFTCLTGSVPYPASSPAAAMWAHISAPVPSATDRRPELPGDVDAVIARGLAKDAADRFDSAGGLATAFARSIGVFLPSRPPRMGARRIGPGSSGSGATRTVVSE